MISSIYFQGLSVANFLSKMYASYYLEQPFWLDFELSLNLEVWEEYIRGLLGQSHCKSRKFHHKKCCSQNSVNLQYFNQNNRERVLINNTL